LELAFSLAEKHLGCPRLLDVEDVVHKADEQGIITYLSFFAQVTPLPISLSLLYSHMCYFKDIESIEPPPNFLASLNVTPLSPSVAKQKPQAKIPAKTREPAFKVAPISTDKAIAQTPSNAPTTPTTPKGAEIGKSLTPRKGETKPAGKDATPPAKPTGDGVEVLNGVINLKVAVDKLGNVVSFLSVISVSLLPSLALTTIISFLP
jgi:hypothetical protein